MASVVITEAARADLRGIIVTRDLPASTTGRVRRSLEVLAAQPRLGSPLEGRWSGLRFILGPWSWMLLVYAWDEVADLVAVVTIQDARSSTAATGGPSTPGS